MKASGVPKAMLLEAEEICYQVFPIIREHVSKYRSKYSKKTYTQTQYVGQVVDRGVKVGFQ
jgi:hypothetical protein